MKIEISRGAEGSHADPLTSIRPNLARLTLFSLLILVFSSGWVEARQTGCGTHQNIGLENGFMLANNNWGSEGQPGSPFQCVYRDPDGTIGWYWNRPAVGTHPDFPEIMHGPKPFGGGTGHTELLPRRVGDIHSMRMWRDGTHDTPGSTGPWSHTVSLWFTADVPDGHNPGHITHEIMINLATAGYYGGDGSGSTQPFAVDDGHAQYHHYRSSPMGHWRIHVFNQAGQQRPLPKQVNIKQFLDYLVANESLTQDDWLACWELGDEMNDNTNGHVHLTTLALEVNGVRRSPTARLVPTDVSISSIPDQSLAANTGAGPISFTVQDDGGDVNQISLSGSSSKTSLAPNNNIVFGGSGTNRTVSVNPAVGQIGVSRITVTATSGSRSASTSFDVVVLSGASPAVFNFDNETLQGWTDRTPANNNNGPRHWAIAPPAFPTVTQAGSGAIGQTIAGAGATQDSSHPTLWLRSPEFTLNGSGNLTVWLLGGTGSGNLTGASTGSVPGNSSDPGFMGVALRNAGSETFVLSGSRGSASGDAWQQIVFTAGQLAALDQNATYTLDLIDAHHGSWGWIAMDSVSIPGTISGSEP